MAKLTKDLQDALEEGHQINSALWNAARDLRKMNANDKKGLWVDPVKRNELYRNYPEAVDLAKQPVALDSSVVRAYIDYWIAKNNKSHGAQGAAAAHFGVTPSAISQVLKKES